MKRQLASFFVFASIILTACGINQKTNNNNSNSEIHSIYRLYVENGGNLTYEEWLESIKGEKGDTGPQGEPGVSITNIEKTSSAGLVDIYTITYSDGHTSTFTVTNGANGQSIKGEPGQDGHTPVVTISDDGYWVIDGTKTGTTAQGPQGPAGNDGQDGKDGTDGKDGRGVVSITLTSSAGNIDTYTITYSDGTTSTFTLTNGVDGQNGAQGDQGIQGNPGADGHTPVIIIGSNGNWFVDGQDTGIKAQGPKGDKGDQGETGPQGPQGPAGNDGYTPYIYEGYWWINGSNTGIRAEPGEVELKLEDNIIYWRLSISSQWQVLFNLDIIRGNDGTNGKSAYEIYRDYLGYEGTEEEWCEEFFSGKLNFKDPGIIDYVPDLKYQVAVGETINLPSKVHAYFSNGDNLDVSITWNKTEIDSSFIGMKKILGLVDWYCTKVNLDLHVASYSTQDLYIDGYVNGKVNYETVRVTAFNNEHIYETTTNSDGYYIFNNIAEGTYTIRIDANGYETVDVDTATITKIDFKNQVMYSNIAHCNFTLKEHRENGFYYIWHSNSDGTSVESMSRNLEKPTIEYSDETLQVNDEGAGLALANDYNITLVDNDLHWTSEVSSRFYELVQTLPTQLFNKKTIWELTNKHVQNDISFEETDGTYYITVAKEAIENVTPRVARIDGKKAAYYSKRFYHALVRVYTNNGYDADMCELILNKSFLCSFNVPNYEALTQYTTAETAESFQEFYPEEKLTILAMFEEMPVGMHKMSELKYLIRRKTGMPHPFYPSAGAVTWYHIENPYIEFMSDGLINYQHSKRLIIHEKAHIFYAYHFSQELKDAWAEIGGWTYNSITEQWSTYKETEFVSAYAHAFNPDEDLAESIAAYVCDPAQLLSRSPNKYNFIRDYIMNGTNYQLRVREDLQFEVYNLDPDYVYPGKIMTTIIKGEGNPFEDKRVTVRLKLFDLYENSGAERFRIRIGPNKIKNQMHDLVGQKVDTKGYVLEGTTVVSKYSAAGYWGTSSASLSDNAGNERFVSPDNFGFKLHLDNPLEDLVLPQVVPGSLTLSVVNANDPNHPDEQLIKANFKYIEKQSGIKRIYLRFYGLGDVTKYDLDTDRASWNDETGEAEVCLRVPYHFSTTTYELESITLTDKATNSSGVNLVHADWDNQIYVETPNPDTHGPVLDVNNISIEAVPTVPEHPNGETKITLTLRVSDDISGFKVGYVYFVNPLGDMHGRWLYTNMPNDSGLYYKDIDTRQEREYTFVLYLPEGSMPGIWGIYSIELYDYSKNKSTYDFTEIIHFDLI